MNKVGGYLPVFLQPKPKPTAAERCSLHYGHMYQVVAKGFDDLARITGVTEGLQYICRSGMYATVLLNPNRFLDQTRVSLQEADSYVNAVRIFYDISYFTGHRVLYDINDKDWARVACNGFFTVADVCCSLSFAGYLKLVNTAEVATKLGNFSVYGLQPFKLIEYTPLSTVCLTASTAAYSLMAISALTRLNEGDESPLTVAYLARAVAELVLRAVLVTAGSFVATTAGVTATASLGLIASGLATYCVYLQTQGYVQAPRCPLKR